MLNFVYLAGIILGMAGQNIVKKGYTQKHDTRGVYFFNVVLSVAAAIVFFVLCGGKPELDMSYVPYSIAYAIACATTSVALVLAISCGSLSLASLFISYSLMLPTLYGIVFLKEPVNLGFIIGLVLLAVSIFLINKTDEESRISFKWFVYILLAFLGNGACCIVQNMQQRASGGAYKNEFMILALIIIAAVMFLLMMIKERRDIAYYAETGWHFAVGNGVLLAVVNLFVMILTGRMAASLLFPLVSVGGLIVTYLIARFWYKEQLTRLQFIGFLIGIVSVVFLNI